MPPSSQVLPLSHPPRFPTSKDVIRTTEDSILAVANQRLPLLLSLFSHGVQSPCNQSSFQTPVEYQVALGPARNAIFYASVRRCIGASVLLFDADICRLVHRPKLRFRRSPTKALTAYGFPPLGLKPQRGQKTAFCLLTRWLLLAISARKMA